MVGGTVVGIARSEGEPTLLHVEDATYGDRCCVRAREGSDLVRVGDAVWWQSGKVYWTPKPNDGRSDIPMEKVGFSFRNPTPDEDYD